MLMAFPYIFLYLLLSHLLADFAFQPEELISWKQKSWKGVFFHATIHFLTMIALFWPMITSINLWGSLVILLTAVSHFFIDRKKIQKEKTLHHYLQTFFFDQFLHVCILVIASLLLTATLNSGQAYFSMLQFFAKFLPVALYFIAVILCTYVYEIIEFQFIRQKHDRATIKFNYKRMFMTMMVLSLIFAVLIFFSGFQIARTYPLSF